MDDQSILELRADYAWMCKL